MIFLHTGLPGHGKTLNTIKEVDAASFEQDRPVYYHNITGLDPSKLKGQWYEFEDPHKWFELPDNSIIFVDECQHFFPPRDTRKERPDYIAHFQTHRHKGFDIHLVTQDMRFIDVEVRRLVGNHVHYWRPFGLNKISRYEYEKATDFEKVSDRAFAKRTIVSVDKSFFGAYKSAVGHHVKVKLPFRVYVIVGVLLVCGFMFYRVYDRLSSSTEVAETPAPETTIQDTAKTLIGGVTSSLGFTPDAATGGSATLTTAQYLERQLPRVADLPSSAPIYDDLTRPVSYPRLYCMSSTDKGIVDRARARQQAVRWINDVLTTCQCYTQQGTRYKTDFDFCMQSSTEGYFDPAVPDRSGQRDMMQQAPQQQQASYAPQQPADIAPVTVTNYQKGRFLW
ncbi:zonular occludens toxin domain-containing protein [Stutzerimonas stutzeri]|uniref:zonular occludens toxin domain-containing protein n=1 Tax=Stutzerimonas stutzeri TaxID=316 RepID=UPI001EF63F9F|nr:zonular occludens toxin domain-containing protein [Stutzerimonas stutzeri]CAB5539024.1 Zonula occludens toxin [Stutzerimonas stutzeri]CAB5587762.1 Zonula occludens toxin [Stutzerimonas stutzeri]CAC9104100.1 Zonula occludens toxin [Stutzerimonas stutzeri]CAC9104203.1 Zonula occludens toxin [Stutzerimonas stutzeri]